MKIIFIGLGSIGQKHAEIILKKYHFQLYAFRSGVNSIPNSLNIPELYSWQDVKILKPDIAFITNPTSFHIETAIRCAKMGCKLFIEKPIGKDLKDLNKLIKIVKNKNLVTYIAYCLRFNPVISKLKEYTKNKKPLHIQAVCTSYFPNWRSDQNHLKSYSASSGLGGGVILDLSHEIDYILYLLGGINRISGNFSKRSNLTVDAEDYADILVTSAKSPANIHINFLSHFKQRLVQIDFDNSTVIGDIINSEIKEYVKEKLAKKYQVKYHKGQEYETQLKYFFDNINNPKMMNNLPEAASLYKKIIAFKEG